MFFSSSFDPSEDGEEDSGGGGGGGGGGNGGDGGGGNGGGGGNNGTDPTPPREPTAGFKKNNFLFRACVSNTTHRYLNLFIFSLCDIFFSSLVV